MNILDHRIHQVTHHHALQIPITKKQTANQPTTIFNEILKSQQTLKLSKHAKERLTKRNIELSDKQWQIINEKMEEAKHKGITDSLIVLNNAALVVSTKNDTVVTAMDLEEANSKIFTNINGTILINE